MFPRDVLQVRRLVAMRRHVHRYGFRLAVSRFPAYVGPFRACLFDPSGEYCGGMTAPDLCTLVDGLGELLQPDGPLLYWPGGVTPEMAEAFQGLRVRLRTWGGSFVVGWSVVGCALPVYADVSLGGRSYRLPAASIWALAELIERDVNAYALATSNPDLL